MEHERFTRKIQAVQQRSQLLGSQIAQLFTDQPELHASSGNVSNLLEELNVAAEAIYEQNEALVASQDWLQAERLRYMELFEFAPDGYIVTDLKGCIQSANRAAATLLNQQAEYLLGKPLVVVVAEDDRKAFSFILGQIPYHPTVRDWEVLFQPRYDAPVRCSVNISAMRDIQGQVCGLYWLLRDISDRKRLETERQQAMDKLSLALQEKNVLLQEVHHRVKNNLQTMSSLLSMQLRRSSNEQVQGILQVSCDRIFAMAKLHEILYQHQDFARINLAHYVKELALNLLDIYQSKPTFIRLKFELPETLTLPVDQAQPFGLICNELLTNAFKYGLNSTPEDEVLIAMDLLPNDELVLTVGQNGDRFPDGFDIEHPLSMGLQLVQMLVIQLGGALTLERNGNNTFTLFKVQFPVFPSSPASSS